MKKNNFIKIITVALLITGFIPGCFFPDCDCPPVEGAYFDINGISVKNYRKSGGQLSENQTVVFSEYGSLLIDYSVDYISLMEKHRSTFNNPFITSALACSCNENGDHGAKTEAIESLTLITLNDFDAEHPANDTINDLFSTYYNGTRYNNIVDFPGQNAGLIQQEDIEMFLSKAPVDNPEFRVKVIFKLNNGEEYTVESKPLKII